MKPAAFELHRPTTLEDALAILAEVSEEGGLVIAGGQSLVPMMALRDANPPHLDDINNIPALRELRVDGEHLSIGSTVRHATFHRPVVDGTLGALLADVSRHIAHYPIRKRGTFCGSLSHADPSSEWCLVSQTLGAQMRLASVNGERVLESDEYFLGAMTTAREPEEILVEARLPLLAEGSTYGFYEFNRRAGDFALGMSLVTFELVDGVIANARVGIGGIEEMPRRVESAEEALNGKPATDETFAEAAAAVCADVEPMDDATTTADYRRDLSGVVVRRALQAAAARANQ